MASSIEATEEETQALQENEDEVNESSLSRRARFKAQPVDKSGWIEVCQSEPQVVEFTGVVRTGQTPGQQVKVQLEMTEDELIKLNQSAEVKKTESGCKVNRRCGPHVVLLTFFFVPISFISSFCMSFYLGTLTWYNSIIFFSEERTIFHKLVICPLVILTFPFTVGLSAVFLSCYACLIQISWYISRWCREIRDFEKGFYGWMCNKLALSQCSPYDIVILNESGEFQTQR